MRKSYFRLSFVKPVKPFLSKTLYLQEQCPFRTFIKLTSTLISALRKIWTFSSQMRPSHSICVGMTPLYGSILCFGVDELTGREARGCEGLHLQEPGSAETVVVTFPPLASKIVMSTNSGQSSKKSRLYRTTVAKYWSSIPYRFRSRFVEY